MRTQKSEIQLLLILLPKDTKTSHYKYSLYGICFDGKRELGRVNLGDRNDATNLIILGVDMSFAGNSYIGNNNIYVLGKDFIQGFSTDVAGHTMSENGIYKANMTEPNIKFVLSLHYNGDNSYFLLMVFSN